MSTFVVKYTTGFQFYFVSSMLEFMRLDSFRTQAQGVGSSSILIAGTMIFIPDGWAGLQINFILSPNKVTTVACVGVGLSRCRTLSWGQSKNVA
mgnify:CR=1 FL=1